MPIDGKSKVIFNLETGDQFNYILQRYSIDDINDDLKRKRTEQKREQKQFRGEKEVK